MLRLELIYFSTSFISKLGLSNISNILSLTNLRCVIGILISDKIPFSISFILLSSTTPILFSIFPKLNVWKTRCKWNTTYHKFLALNSNSIVKIISCFESRVIYSNFLKSFIYLSFFNKLNSTYFCVFWKKVKFKYPHYRFKHKSIHFLNFIYKLLNQEYNIKIL